MYVQPDAERVTVDILAASMAGRATVAIGIPKRWNGEPHVQVESDGTPDIEYPARFGSIVRLTAWAKRRTEAKSLAALAAATLDTYAGALDARYRITSGVMVIPDDETDAELATCLLSLDQRGIPA